MADTLETIQTENDGGVRTITLNRPDVLNAFNNTLLRELGKAVKAAAKDVSVRCLVITGAGRAFCSGQDLAEVLERYKSPEPIDLGERLRNNYNPIVKSIRTMDKPVLAAVNGVAAGAGASLALACDLRIAADTASFVQAFVNVGLVPDCGGTFSLPRLVGFARAMELAMTGRKVDAEEALRIGLVNRVVETDALSGATSAFAGKLATMPTKAIALMKRAINNAWTADLDEQLEYEAMVQATAGQSHDHREGVMAFIEKRKPDFKGE